MPLWNQGAVRAYIIGQLPIGDEIADKKRRIWRNVLFFQIGFRRFPFIAERMIAAAGYDFKIGRDSPLFYRLLQRLLVQRRKKKLAEPAA